MPYIPAYEFPLANTLKKTPDFRHEHINQELLKSRGIKAGYTPGVLTNDVADHNICLTLSVLRRVKELIG